MVIHVEQNETDDKGVRFEARGRDVYLVRGSAEQWVGQLDETCEAMAAFLAAEDFGE